MHSPSAAPVQAPLPMLHTAEAAFDLAVPHGMPRAGHPHTGRALCAVVGPCKLQLKTASDPRMYVFFGTILCINPLFESTEIV